MKNILLTMLLLPFMVSQGLTQKAVNGKVTALDEGELPGVTILIKGTSRGTVTDAEGNYNIEIPEEEAILIFSYVGYLSEEVVVGDQMNIDVELLPDIQSLQEVVVIGYGTQRRKEVTGAITSLNTEDIMDTPVLRVEQSLCM